VLHLAASGVTMGTRSADRASDRRSPDKVPMHSPKTTTRRRLACGAHVLAAVLAILGLQAGPSQAIVGGASVAPGTFHFIASLRDNGHPYCGATLISPQWLLTAAHCVSGRSPAQLTAVVDQVRIAGDGRPRTVDRVIVDPAYESATETYDVALVHLSSPTSAIAPAPLIRSGDGTRDAPGTVATVIGYGSTAAQALDGSGPVIYPDTLQQAQVSVITNQQCSSVFNGRDQPAARADLMLCAGGDGHHDACVGDSGGPLLVPGATPGTWLDVAVISWGAGCAVPGVPGVYTRLADPAVASFVANTAGS
jgi:secreted trypsin-like serine protease